MLICPACGTLFRALGNYQITTLTGTYVRRMSGALSNACTAACVVYLYDRDHVLISVVIKEEPYPFHGHYRRIHFAAMDLSCCKGGLIVCVYCNIHGIVLGL
jgi:hypothetical protein